MTNTDTTPTKTDADHLIAALDAVREWRHRQPHHDASRCAELDAILDDAAVGEIEARIAQDAPASLPEAVEAHHCLIRTRRRAFEDARRAWDEVEAGAIRRIAAFMPPAGRDAEAPQPLVEDDADVASEAA